MRSRPCVRPKCVCRLSLFVVVDLFVSDRLARIEGIGSTIGSTIGSGDRGGDVWNVGDLGSYRYRWYVSLVLLLHGLLTSLGRERSCWAGASCAGRQWKAGWRKRRKERFVLMHSSTSTFIAIQHDTDKTLTTSCLGLRSGGSTTSCCAGRCCFSTSQRKLQSLSR